MPKARRLPCFLRFGVVWVGYELVSMIWTQHHLNQVICRRLPHNLLDELVVHRSKPSDIRVPRPIAKVPLTDVSLLNNRGRAMIRTS